jgi:hypothetical protein
MVVNWASRHTQKYEGNYNQAFGEKDALEVFHN